MIALCASVLGIYAFFLTWSILQERISTTPYGADQERFRYFIVLNGVQAFCASLVALAYIRCTGRRLGWPSPELLKRYIQAACTNALASPFGYAALKHIDYPTLILGKSCKLVPVMFVSFVLYGRRYPLYKYVSVAAVTAGVSGFMLLQPAKAGSSASSSLFGLSLLLINLLLDGATNSTQDQIFHKHRVSGQQMMCFMNLFGGLLMVLWLLNPWNPELGQAIAFCARHPSVIKDVLVFSCCGALGQCFIFFTLARFGSLVLVTVTVTRKMFSMLLSVFWFGHQMNAGQWAGVGVVFAGITLEAYMKSRESSSSKKQQQQPAKQEKEKKEREEKEEKTSSASEQQPSGLGRVASGESTETRRSSTRNRRRK
ncbi:UAA transporter [Syncephalis pseudoplumigaleata]|uniref:UDP-galactose transporter homolog 1 n=1 Tax=Syncephalis pseudoplumigaleata TaxID=1712513 RepID=A0A4P9YXS8_9FUNG|nr:UAA transporter [Syncephalis pseudoplumigaleata]|eukprot:RKP23770.1 UAA transporter [Syncephalis pseudoplumigaleata]